MADNVTTQTATLASIPTSKIIAAREVSYSGDTALVSPVGLVAFAGSDDAKTVADIPGDATNGLDVDVTRMAALVAGSAVVGKVGIDQTTPGTTDSVSVATAQGAGATIGATTGAAVITDANGTLQQYLRGLVKLLITAGTIVLGTGANLIGYVGGKHTYAGKVSLTTTNFDTLANGSGWQSVGIATNGAIDIHFNVKTTSTGTLFVDFYIATKLSDGSNWTDGATGTEGTFTAANRLNSRYAFGLRMNNGASAGGFALSDVFGKTIPSNVALISINACGAAITTATTTFDYERVN